MAYKIDRTGKRYGRWIVLGHSHESHKGDYWACRCDCGTERAVIGGSLGKSSSSCGCKNRENSLLSRKKKVKSLRERILNAITVNEKTGCWEFCMFLDINGYGRVNAGNGKTVFAHRTMYEEYKGSAEGKFVLHRCDNPKCCNPEHLFLGNAKDNYDDMVSKGRHKRGSQLPQSKITENDVIEIRRMYSSGEKQRVIGDIFGINQATVSEICSLKKWKHVGYHNDDWCT